MHGFQARAYECHSVHPFLTWHSGCGQVDMVEVSPTLRQKQWETLGCQALPGASDTIIRDAASGPRSPSAPLIGSEADSVGRSDRAPTEGTPREGTSGYGNIQVGRIFLACCHLPCILFVMHKEMHRGMLSTHGDAIPVFLLRYRYHITRRKISTVVKSF